MTWITLKEKLPQRNTPLLVAWDKDPFHAEGYQQPFVYKHIVIFDEVDGEYQWFDCLDNNLEELEAEDTPTHWMYLPKFP